MNAKIKISICAIIFFASCSSNDNSDSSSEIPQPSNNNINSLEYIDEIIIPDQNIDGIPIGGFSGIDYKNNTWYIISDGSNPIKYYTAEISYNLEGFSNVSINTMIEIKDEIGNSIPENQIDPEAIRFDTKHRQYNIYE